MDDSMLRGMIAESVQLGSGLSGSGRVVVDRVRVLAEHGASSEEEALEFDQFVLRVGGSIRRLHGIGGGFVWDLPRTVLDASPTRGEPTLGQTRKRRAP